MNTMRTNRPCRWSLGELDLYEDLRGSAWKDPADHELDLIGLPGGWGRAAIEAAQTKVVSGLPTLTLPFVIILKLISARPQDTADISRMSGAASKAALDRVRVVVGRYRPRKLENLDQMIRAGKLEYGAARDSGLAPAGRCRVCGRALKSAASLRAGVGPDCAQKEEGHRP